MLLASAAAAGSLADSARGQVPATSSSAWFSSSDRQVSVVVGTDPEFWSAAGPLFPGLQADAGFQKLLPLAILVTNDKGRGILATTACWAVPSPSGGMHQVALFHYVPPGTRYESKSGATLESARKPLIPRGGSLLITPVAYISPARYRPGGVNWSSLQAQSSTAGYLLSQVGTGGYKGPYAFIDAVLFRDYKIAGIDAHRLGRRIRSARNGQRDEAFTILKLIRGGASNEAIQSALMSHAAPAQGRMPQDGPRAWYLRSRQVHAQFLTKLSNRLTRKRFITALRYNVAMGHTVITRLSPAVSVSTSNGAATTAIVPSSAPVTPKSETPPVPNSITSSIST